MAIGSKEYLNEFISPQLADILKRTLNKADHIELSKEYSISLQTIQRVCNGTTVLTANSQPMFIHACMIAFQKNKIRTNEIKSENKILRKIIKSAA